jgi:hypothetical protein
LILQHALAPVENKITSAGGRARNVLWLLAAYLATPLMAVRRRIR